MTRRGWICLLEWVKVLAIALVVTMSLRMFVFEIVRVEGDSMQSTLATDDRVYIDKLFFRFRGPQRGDVVECYYGEDRTRTYIKRVIGLPGECLEIRAEGIYIDGVAYHDPWLEEHERNLLFLSAGTWQIPEDCYFVMGDNRLDSLDSRSQRVGFIPRENILGRGAARIWPISDWCSLS